MGQVTRALLDGKDKIQIIILDLSPCVISSYDRVDLLS